MPESKKRKKKGFKGHPTPKGQKFSTELPQMLRTMSMLDEIEEELLLKQLEEKENEDAPE